jgi:hypothetical protein
MLVGGLMARSSPAVEPSGSADVWAAPAALVYDEAARTATSIAPPGLSDAH